MRPSARSRSLLRGAWIATALSALVLSGCGGWRQKQYDGPRRSAAELALVRVERPAVLLLVDQFDAFGTEFEILPGTHRLTVAYQMVYGNVRQLSRNNFTILFKAEAGRVHLLRAQPSEDKWMCALFDESGTHAIAVPEK